MMLSITKKISRNLKIIRVDEKDYIVTRYLPLSSVARAVDCDSSKISACYKGERNSIAGYKWVYDE